MKDLVPKGTGNSRFLRSSIPENITHEELVALLRAGTFPVDFAGLNADGVAVVGSAYSKANVLPDDVCTAMGIPTSSEPKDAFLAVKTLISDRLVTGTYNGDGADEQSIELGFEPLAVFVRSYNFLFCEFSSNRGFVNFEYVFRGISIGPESGIQIHSSGFTAKKETYLTGVPQMNTLYKQYYYMALRE